MTGHERAKRRALIVRRHRAMVGNDLRSQAQRARWARIKEARQEEEPDLEHAGDPDADLQDLPDGVVG